MFPKVNRMLLPQRECHVNCVRGMLDRTYIHVQRVGGRFSALLACKRCPKRNFLDTTQWRWINYGLKFIFLLWHSRVTGDKCPQIASSYVDMLRKVSLITEGPRLREENWIFQQDNAAIHNAHRSKEFFFLMENNNVFFSHPSCSPDLNRIENVWEWMVKTVYKLGSQFETVNAFCAAVFGYWKSIPTTLIQKLIIRFAKTNFWSNSQK